MQRYVLFWNRFVGQAGEPAVVRKINAVIQKLDEIIEFKLIKQRPQFSSFGAVES